VIEIDDALHVASANDRARDLLGESAVRTGQPFAVEPLRALAERLVSTGLAEAPTSVESGDGRTLRAIGIPAHAGEPAVLLIEDVTGEQRHDRVRLEFVRNAAHQLRTPLTGIVAAVEVLQAGAKEIPQERDRFLDHIEGHAARLSRMAHGLLVLARLQAGEVAQPKRVEVKPVLDALAGDAVSGEGVEVLTDCTPGLAALAERDLLREALAALLENALAHTHAGRVSLRAWETDGRVAIEISDSGGGIAPADHARIFDPFYRSSPTGEGFGLGLAIAAQAVGAMGGEIEAANADGGARFTVRLPSAGTAR